MANKHHHRPLCLTVGGHIEKQPVSAHAHPKLCHWRIKDFGGKQLRGHVFTIKAVGEALQSA